MLTQTRNRIRGIWELGLQLAKAEFKLRNEGSYLGILWYLLNPILTFGILYLIFSARLGNNISYYPAYLLMGIIIFNIFQNTTMEASKAILKEYHHLIKSINFPRESLVLAIVLKNIFSHMFEIILFALMLVYLHINPLSLMYYIPLLILFTLFLYGSALLIASLTVYFVDLDNIWNFASRIIWFGTPIFYAIENQAQLYHLNLFNPMYYFITAGRELVIYNNIPPLGIIWGTIGFSLGFFLIGSYIFKLLKTYFAERI